MKDKKRMVAINILRWRYNMDCSFTDQEVSDEISMLKRKHNKGSLDDKTLPYYCKMQSAGLI